MCRVEGNGRRIGREVATVRVDAVGETSTVSRTRIAAQTKGFSDNYLRGDGRSLEVKLVVVLFEQAKFLPNCLADQFFCLVGSGVTLVEGVRCWAVEVVGRRMSERSVPV